MGVGGRRQPAMRWFRSVRTPDSRGSPAVGQSDEVVAIGAPFSAGIPHRGRAPGPDDQRCVRPLSLGLETIGGVHEGSDFLAKHAGFLFVIRTLFSTSEATSQR